MQRGIEVEPLLDERDVGVDRANVARLEQLENELVLHRLDVHVHLERAGLEEAEDELVLDRLRVHEGLEAGADRRQDARHRSERLVLVVLFVMLHFTVRSGR